MRTLLLIVFFFCAGFTAEAQTCRELFGKKSSNAKGSHSRKAIPSETLLKMISHLDKNGFHISTRNMKLDSGGIIKSELNKEFNYDANPATLMATLLKRFGSWREVLRQANVDTSRYEGAKRITPKIISDQEIFEMLRFLDTSGFRITSYSMSTDSGGLIGKALKEEFNYKANASSILHTALNRFGTWENTLLLAGIDIQKYLEMKSNLPSRKYWDRQSIIEVLVKMQKADIPLNSNAVDKDHRGVLRQYFIDFLKISSSPSTLYRSAISIFGSWDQALIAANINPDHVRLVGTTPAALLRHWMLDERRANTADWLYGRKVYQSRGKDDFQTVVVDDNTPESAFLKTEREKVLTQQIEQLKLDEKFIFNEMIKEIEVNGLPEVNRESLAEVMAEGISKRLGINANKAQIKSQIEATMVTLLESSALREYLDD